MSKLLSKLPWLLLGLVAAFLGWYVLMVATVQQAGDIVEYYGVTESLVNHGGVSLTLEDRVNLEQVLHKAYFEMSGYYIEGRKAARYPVHFWFYSLLAVPVRLLLSLTELDLRRSLFFVNWLSIICAVGFIWTRYVKDWFKRIALLVLVFTGALMSFLIWPGPDLWYLSLLLIVPFAFFEGECWLAAGLTALASWHSQPLIVFAAGLTAYAIYQSWLTKIDNQTLLKPDIKPLIWAGLLGLMALIPYVYNLYAFGVLTPWTKLQDGWTIMNGFGLHNASLWKFWEQWFDLNVGLFWYAPVVFVLALVGVWKMRSKKQQLWFFAGLSILTAFFYQTNPAWHYGTVGFGPGRHGVYLLPILIYFALQALSKKVWGVVLIAVIISSQVWGLSLNGYLEPDFTKTLQLSPFAEFVLNRWPQWYSPTPEIFVDRVNHTDLDYPTTAIYKRNGQCVKAYALMTDEEQLKIECGGIPEAYQIQFDNSYVRLANYSREVVTKEATFWPEPGACADGFTKTEQKPFQCMRTEGEFLKLTGLLDASRLAKVPNFDYPGIWKVTWGVPVKLTIPAGYIINHYAMNGVYVDYPIKK